MEYILEKEGEDRGAVETHGRVWSKESTAHGTESCRE